MIFLVWVCPSILTASKHRVTHRNLEMRHIYNFKGKGELGGLKLLVEEAKNRPLKTQREEPPLSFSPNVGDPPVPSHSFDSMIFVFFLFTKPHLLFGGWGETN